MVLPQRFRRMFDPIGRAIRRPVGPRPAPTRIAKVRPTVKPTARPAARPRAPRVTPRARLAVRVMPRAMPRRVETPRTVRERLRRRIEEKWRERRVVEPLGGRRMARRAETRKFFVIPGGRTERQVQFVQAGRMLLGKLGKAEPEEL